MEAENTNTSMYDSFQVMYAGAPQKLRAAIDSFLLGVNLTSRTNHRRIEDWRNQMTTRLSGIKADQSSSAEALTVIEQLKTEYVALVINRQNYRTLLIYWAVSAALCILVQVVLGEDGLLKLGTDHNLVAFGSIYGHFDGYISFKYALYGVILGNALLLSYRRSTPSFNEPSHNQGLLERPLLNLVIGTVLAYIMCRLVAEGKFSANILGFEIRREDTKDGPGFHDSGVLFFLGLASSIAADVYLQRLIESARSSAAKAFSVSTWKPE